MQTHESQLLDGEIFLRESQPKIVSLLSSKMLNLLGDVNCKRPALLLK
jgi:hypothetical protein